MFDEKECFKNLEVDEYNLQEEWLKQPSLFLEYSLKLSSLIKKKSLLRKEIIDNVVRNPESFGISKISEASIERVLSIDEKMIALTYEMDCTSAAVKSFYQRKESLEHEQQLLQGGFFSEPKEKPPINSKRKRKEKS